MNTLSGDTWPPADRSYVPWALLGLIWLGAVASHTGLLALATQESGTEALFGPPAAGYLAEFKRDAYHFFSVPGLAFVFLFYPKWSWLPCLLLLIGTVATSIVFSAYTFPTRVFLLSNLLPALFYGLALSISIRHRRRLLRNDL
jgi:hypothetical protein